MIMRFEGNGMEYACRGAYFFFPVIVCLHGEKSSKNLHPEIVKPAGLCCSNGVLVQRLRLHHNFCIGVCKKA